MSGRELASYIACAKKSWRVRVTNGVSEHRDLLVECHTRKHAEKTATRLERDGFPARVEAILG